MALNRMSESGDCRRWVDWSIQIEAETGKHVATVPIALAWRMRLERTFG
jgi:hypothetical protein